MDLSRSARRGHRLAPLLYVPLIALLAACASLGGPETPQGASQPSAPPHQPPIGYSIHKAPEDTCPAVLSHIPTCQTPHAMRVAYGMEGLIEHGMTGKGQTVIDIVSFGSPTLQKDLDSFDRQFGLPSTKVQVLSPIGSVPFNPANSDMNSWATETTLDVELIHTMAPGANIVVLTSPVDETEGTIGLPQFLQLERYAVDHHLGQIFSQSYVASETTLNNPAGHALVQTYTDFYKRITTQEGWTVLTGSGDHGATDYIDLASTKFSPTPIVNFPADVPWVTAVGGTTLISTGQKINETAWNGSGGGFSAFFSTPDYQRGLPANLQSQAHGQRGIPDIAANADPLSAMAIFVNGQWQQVGGTSAATPTWAGIIAVANQMAGHPLGFLNPTLYRLATSSKAAGAFRDITSGNNSFNQGKLAVRGFSAAPGWDAVTGWGAPNGEKLLPALIEASKS